MKRVFKYFYKFLGLVLALLLVLGLGACGDDPSDNEGDGGNGNGGGNNNNHQWTENELYWDSNKNGTPDWAEKEINLTYATWQYNDPEAITIDTLLIDAFMAKYPNVHVTMDILGQSGEWETNFLERLSTNNVPDVFLINRLENMLPYNVLADLTEFYNHDDDTQYLFDSIKNLGLYEGKRYCIPTFIYPEIWVVNKD